MAQTQYLSTDPTAGEYLSADPSAGEGYWEDKGGFIGKVWHPPGVLPGQDPTSHRVDTDVVPGIAPETLLLGLQGGRFVLDAMRNLPSGAQRALAGVQASLRFATPLVKFEASRMVLRRFGVPDLLAEPIAFGIAGYRRGGPTAAEPAPAPPEPAPTGPAGTGTAWRPGWMPPTPVTEPAPAAAAAGPVASAPAAPAPPTAPATPQFAPTPPPPSGSGFGWSPQQIRNEVGQAARRAKLTLSADDLAQADALVQAGQTPETAVRTVAPPPKPPKLKVTAAEMGEYTRLRKLGKSHAEATGIVQAQRDFAARFGTPSSEAVRQAVEKRNVTGEWPE
jgi:hypothetical protein